ncbi:MAG: hypothetical protein KAI66_26490, partial [Lentisphaeria bacterium]|nr:hypothetical protein [Lentisphaeria bacterium]
DVLTADDDGLPKTGRVKSIELATKSGTTLALPKWAVIGEDEDFVRGRCFYGDVYGWRAGDEWAPADVEEVLACMDVLWEPSYDSADDSTDTQQDEFSISSREVLMSLLVPSLALEATLAAFANRCRWTMPAEVAELIVVTTAEQGHRRFKMTTEGYNGFEEAFDK